ncbi:MAG TPA: fructosamine kinase family protein [Gammaproteobacteria bacterium]|nr:fructosamine kinase family protein [Gammaproteobacteria bacterium]
MSHWQSIESHIGEVTGQPFSVKSASVAGGGSINSASVLSDGERRYFVKTNRSGRLAMFEAEARGLLALAGSHTIRVPQAVCYGDDGERSYIVLEYLDLTGSADQQTLGEQLAAMHHVTAGAFGWEIDNTIGSTHQPNPWTPDWLDFWREHRLGYQLRLAAQNGYGGELQSLGEQLLAAMPVLFAGRTVLASMLHGDLWGGNVGGLKDGTPVIFDPAFYYGDREADIAMTYVFGGFTPRFYDAYNSVYPLEDGFALRRTFYNIYHIINHLNMFGGGYHGQAIHMMEQVLAELR